MIYGALPDVSRETNDRLNRYCALLEKWNPRINLVSRSSLAELWDRHIVDSAQVVRTAPGTCKQWVDIGSGGGLPGIVAAIILSEAHLDAHVTLIESDQRKSALLRTALRETGCTGTVLAERVEAADPAHADVLSARALADFSVLLGFAQRHLAPGGIALFPKGATWRKEVDAARSSWQFDLDVVKSETDPSAAILKVSGVSRV